MLSWLQMPLVLGDLLKVTIQSFGSFYACFRISGHTTGHFEAIVYMCMDAFVHVFGNQFLIHECTSEGTPETFVKE